MIFVARVDNASNAKLGPPVEHLGSESYSPSLEGKHLPTSLWKDKVLHLPQPLIDAHRKQLMAGGWMPEYLAKSASSGAVGGASKSDAEYHFITRFLNSAARAQYVCADPTDSQTDIRDMILDQLADGRIFILDLAAGSGAGTLAILSLIGELRSAGCIPKLPLNVHLFGVDYSPNALSFYQETLSEVAEWLEGMGIEVELDSWPCDLKVVGEFSEILESFFEDARKREVRRFLCVLSAISGLGKDGLEEIHKSLEAAAIRLSHKGRESSWLWIEPSGGNTWLFKFLNSIKLALQQIPYILSRKKESFEIKSCAPLLVDPEIRQFGWQDPYQPKVNNSQVMVVGFRND